MSGTLRRLILHVGQHKTGTTMLQSTLLRSRQDLIGQGILYPTPYKSNNHAGIVPYFFGYEAASFHSRLRNNFDREAVLSESQKSWDLILQELQAQTVDTAIISAELLFGAGKHDGFEHFIAALRSCAEELHVVAYVRSPADHYLSLKQQNLKHALPRLTPREDQRNRDALEAYLNAEGTILHVHAFDRDKMRGGDIVNDFFSRHLPSDTLDVVTRPPQDENTSISPEAMVVLDELRGGRPPKKYAHYGRPSEEYADLIRRTDDEVPGKTRPRYKPGIARIIFDAKLDHDWLYETFGIRFDRPAEDPAADGLTVNDLTSVRSLCHINEERYQRLWAALPPPKNARLRWAGRKIRNGIKHPLKSLSRPLRLLSRPMQ